MKCPNCQHPLTATVLLEFAAPRTTAPHSKASVLLTVERFLSALDSGTMDFAGGPIGTPNHRAPLRYNPKLNPGQIRFPYRPTRTFVYETYERWHLAHEKTRPMSRAAFYRGLSEHGLPGYRTNGERYINGFYTLTTETAGDKPGNTEK